MSCFDLTHAPVATAARAAATGLVSMSTRPDSEGSDTVEIGTRRWVNELSYVARQEKYRYVQNQVCRVNTRRYLVRTRYTYVILGIIHGFWLQWRPRRKSKERSRYLAPPRHTATTFCSLLGINPTTINQHHTAATASTTAPEAAAAAAARRKSWEGKHKPRSHHRSCLSRGSKTFAVPTTFVRKRRRRRRKAQQAAILTATAGASWVKVRSGRIGPRGWPGTWFVSYLQLCARLIKLAAAAPTAAAASAAAFCVLVRCVCTYICSGVVLVRSELEGVWCRRWMPQSKKQQAITNLDNNSRVPGTIVYLRINSMLPCISSIL